MIKLNTKSLSEKYQFNFEEERPISEENTRTSENLRMTMDDSYQLKPNELDKKNIGFIGARKERCPQMGDNS